MHTAVAENQNLKLSRDMSESRTTLTHAEFADFYQEYFQYFRMVAAAHSSIDQADDVVQRAALSAMKRLKHFERGTAFKAWFATFVRNEARNYSRSLRRHTLKLARHQPEDRAPHQTERSSDSMSAKRLRECLDGLSAAQRECILLRVLSECSYSQIASITGESEPTSRSHVHRARSRLADCLGPILSGAL